MSNRSEGRSNMKKLREALEGLSPQQLKNLYKGLDIAAHEKAIAIAKRESSKKEKQKLEKQLQEIQRQIAELDK